MWERRLANTAMTSANRRLLILWQLRDALIRNDAALALHLARRLTGLAAALPMGGYEE